MSVNMKPFFSINLDIKPNPQVKEPMSQFPPKNKEYDAGKIPEEEEDYKDLRALPL